MPSRKHCRQPLTPPILSPRKNAVYIGVDPGANGGIAALYNDSVRFKPIPKTEEETLDLIDDYVGVLDNSYASSADQIAVRAVIEWISPAMFGTAKGSNSKLYGSYMALRMALTAADIPFLPEKPQVWQPAVGVSTRKKSESRGQWKRRLKRKAEELFPKLLITLATADALLLAYYCRMTQGGAWGHGHYLP